MKSKKVVDFLNEASFPNRAGEKLNNIDNALSEVYDQMTQSDKNFKDKIFSAYYRFYMMVISIDFLKIGRASCRERV